MGKLISSHRQLEVWQRAFRASMEIFKLSKGFPKEELYSLTSQIRRCSRSVATSITEAWRKRRYPLVFVSKLSDADTEAAETRIGCTTRSSAATSIARLAEPFSRNTTGFSQLSSA
jgi:four helix bundle protein